MNDINYSWNESDSNKTQLLEEKIEVDKNQDETKKAENLSTRHNMQIMRRLFHICRLLVVRVKLLIHIML